MRIAAIVIVAGMAQQPATSPAAPPAGETAKPVVYKATSDVVLARLKKPVMPLFPEAALQSGAKGEAVFELVIASDGSFKSARQLFGDPVFAEASIAAMRQWRFDPFEIKGKRVAADVVSQIGFSFGNNAGQTSVSPVFIFGDFADVTQPRSGANGEPVPQRVRVSGGVMAKQLLHTRSPKYPEDAKSNRIQGTVVLAALIDRNGSIKSLKIVSATSMSLAYAVLEAAKEWRYRPYLLNGEPVEVETQIVTNFTLNGG
jgi:TonB family protein